MDIFEIDGDVQAENGDLKVPSKSQADRMHMETIVTMDKGEHKLFPLIGVGIRSILKGPLSLQEIKNRIKRNLEADNFEVDNIYEDANGELQIEARRLEENG